MSVTFEQLINSFMEGMSDTEDAAKSSTGTLKIQGDQLIHYGLRLSNAQKKRLLLM